MESDDSVKLLIIDDSPLVRTVLREYLAETGYQVFEAGTSLDANIIFAKELPEIVIKDLFMPDSDTVAMIRCFKKVNPNVKIILCSTGSSKEHMLSGLKAGAEEFVLKPLEKEQVILAIKRVAAS